MGTLNKLVEGARGFACELYRLQPKALIPNLPNDALRFAWDKMCGEPPSLPSNLPPPPSVQYNGGQCVCVIYRVDYQFGSGFRDVTVLYGPVGGLRIRLIPRGNNRFDGANEAYCRGIPGSFGTGCTPQMGWFQFGYNPNQSPSETIKIVSISREDGRFDNCGDPAPDYPNAPSVPDGGFTSQPTPIVLNDNDTINVVFNLTPPSVSPPSVAEIPPIVVNVKTPQLSIPISFNFSGDTNVGTPVAPPLLLPPDVINAINNTNTNTNTTNNTVNNINNTVNNTYPPQSLVDNPDVEEEEEDVEDGKEEEKGVGILGLAVTLTTLPQKSQYGSPNVYFGGWIAFKRDGGYTPREQIFFERSFFLAPPGASGYTITLTNGAKGVVKVYSRKQ